MSWLKFYVRMRRTKLGVAVWKTNMTDYDVLKSGWAGFRTVTLQRR